MKRIFGSRKAAIFLLVVSPLFLKDFFTGNFSVPGMSPLGYWFCFVSFFILLIPLELFAFFIPFYTYDQKGIKQIGLKKWLWKNVSGVYTQGWLRNTLISFKPCGLVVLSPDTTHRYYKIMNEILDFIPKEKVDEFTFKVIRKRAKRLDK